MKKCFYLIMCFILVVAITSCAAYEDDPNGIRYNYFQKMMINGEEYNVYLPDDTLHSFEYYYTQSYSVSTLETWTINMEYTTKYINKNDLVLDDGFYSMLPLIEDSIKVDFPTVKINKNGEKEEIEFTLENPENKEINYVLIEYYYPIKLQNLASYENHYLYVPVYKDMLIKTTDQIQTLTKDSYISVEEFFSQINVHSKKDVK